MLEVNCKLSLPGQQLSYQVSTPNKINCLGIKGDSGCGKTTLLRIMAGFEKHAKGTVKFVGQNWQNTQQQLFISPSKRKIGFVFQDARLFPHLNVEQNIAFKGRCRGDDGFTFERIIETLDVSHLLNRKPANLSGGEKQRVAIARALASKPHFLMLDEPLTGIGHNHKLVILNYLQELNRQHTIPIVYVSHVDEELQKISDGIINLNLTNNPLTDVSLRQKHGF